MGTIWWPLRWKSLAPKSKILRGGPQKIRKPEKVKQRKKNHWNKEEEKIVSLHTNISDKPSDHRSSWPPEEGVLNCNRQTDTHMNMATVWLNRPSGTDWVKILRHKYFIYNIYILFNNIFSCNFFYNNNKKKIKKKVILKFECLLDIYVILCALFLCSFLDFPG